ncbi:hypothetical protein [Streptomyces europaeiscabiei]|uniref:hypothetical protein n=1 Tax=Streptomyces europaeiscabiei TaxID=146819 RepID=UPI0038F7DFF5
MPHARRPVANGLSTDHPAPHLPFVDDTHLHLGHDDTAGSRAAAVRHTLVPDPRRPELVWSIRIHPRHGRSVLLHQDTLPPTVHPADEPLLLRAGGYTWDTAGWHRPGHLWDASTGTYQRQPVPAAVTITAAQLIEGQDVRPDNGRILDVTSFASDPPAPGDWTDSLALWARLRTGTTDGIPLQQSIVTFTAPELDAERLLGVPQVAALAGITASALRAYISRGVCDVPEAQVTIGRRDMWSRPVAQNWAEARRKAAPPPPPVRILDLPAGADDVRRHLEERFFTTLWAGPARRRWTLQHRTPEAVRQLAGELAQDAALSLGDIVPLTALAVTAARAALHDLAGPQRQITAPVARMLTWLEGHDPALAHTTVEEIVADASRRLGLADTAARQAVFGACTRHALRAPSAAHPSPL